MASMANGHMRYLLTLMSFLIPFMLITLIAGIITLLLNRISDKAMLALARLQQGLTWVPTAF